MQNLSGQRFGKYELRDLLGAGGMGAVYRAFQIDLERDVAIKVLSPTLVAQTGYMDRFNREAKTVASLEHRHIVPIYDYGTEGDISYLVMRRLSGGTLAQRIEHSIAAGEALPSLPEVSRLLREIASALDYAHSRGVIHRDLKPSNVMFDSQGSAYLVDFGIVKLLNATALTSPSMATLGTPAYMSPEQWRGEALTPAADQYALGIIAYTLVTGRLPFEADTPHVMMYKHLGEQPTPPEAWRPGLPEGIASVIRRALSKNPAERYPTALAFADAFDKASTGVPEEETNFFSTPPLAGQHTPSRRLTTIKRPEGSPPSRGRWLGAGLAALLVIGIVLVGAIFVLSSQTPAAATPAAATPTATTEAASADGETTELPTRTPRPTSEPLIVVVPSPTSTTTSSQPTTVDAIQTLGPTGEPLIAVVPSPTSTRAAGGQTALGAIRTLRPNLQPSATSNAIPTAVEASETPVPTTPPPTATDTTVPTEALSIAVVATDAVTPLQTPEPTATETLTPSDTPEPTDTDTPPTETDTPEPTSTDTATPDPTATPSDTSEPTPTNTETPTETPAIVSIVVVLSSTSTRAAGGQTALGAIQTLRPNLQPSATSSAIPIAAEPSVTPVPTTPPPTATDTATDTATPLPTNTPSLTPTPSETPTPTDDTTATAAAAQTATANAPTFTPTPTPTPTDTATPSSTPTPFPTPTATRAPVPTVIQNAEWTPVIQSFDGVEMALVPPGCFNLGSSEAEIDAALAQCEVDLGVGQCQREWFEKEGPQTQICFAQPFWIDRTEVTNGQFGSAGSFAGDDRPRETISWLDALTYCVRRGGRLPTEAEWEYAARGPDNLSYPWGNTFVPENSVYDSNSGDQTSPVASRPGGMSWIGAHDLSGNVREWTSSILSPYPYDAADGRENLGDVSAQRSVRGGSWFVIPVSLRTSDRTAVDSVIADWNIGFRCLRAFRPSDVESSG